MAVRIITGDCRDVLATLADESVHCCVTSPPYWGLRDYGVQASVWGGDEACEHEWGATVLERATNHVGKARWQHTRNGRDEEQPTHKRVGWLRADIPQGEFCQNCGAWAGSHGLEPDYGLFVENEVSIFREVRRVLRSDGTLWLNLGDSYATGAGKVGAHPGGGEQGERWRGGPPSDKSTLKGNGHVGGGPKLKSLAPIPGHRGRHTAGHSGKHGPRIEAMGPMTQPNRMPGLKAKDLCGIPWRVAFALQADGWYLRQDIIWSKPNPMPESVTDRCTKAHEYLFLLSKSERYFYDAEAVREDSDWDPANTKMPDGWDTGPGGHGAFHRNGREKGKRTRGVPPRHAQYESSDQSGLDDIGRGAGRNKRSVWSVATAPFPDAHFATFPPALIEPCIKAGCPAGGTVLDPFGGAGTTGMVADRLRRNAILIDINPDYNAMAERRIKGDGGMLCEVSCESGAA